MGGWTNDIERGLDAGRPSMAGGPAGPARAVAWAASGPHRPAQADVQCSDGEDERAAEALRTWAAGEWKVGTS
jgi:hypothetical protein